MDIAVLCSGEGTNFQAIADAGKRGELGCNIALMVCDNPDAFALKRAKNEGIPSLLVERNDFSTEKEYEAEIIKNLRVRNVELVVMAGYMRMLSGEFIEKYLNRIINIHPALLPSFKGKHGIRDALDYGVKVTGVTVHFADKKADHGPIILQEAVRIKPNDTEATLGEHIHAVEHRLYPEAIRLFAEGRLLVKGRKVEIRS